MHVLFSKRSNAAAAQACPMAMADEIQHRLGGAFQAGVERYALDLEDADLDFEDAAPASGRPRDILLIRTYDAQTRHPCKKLSRSSSSFSLSLFSSARSVAVSWRWSMRRNRLHTLDDSARRTMRWQRSSSMFCEMRGSITRRRSPCSMLRHQLSKLSVSVVVRSLRLFRK